MVHLFYLDERVIDRGEAGRAVNHSLREYKLLFAGETIAFSLQQTPLSRGLVLQCVDFSSYWDTAHATAISYGLGGNWATQQGSIRGSNISLFDDIVHQMPEMLVQWLGQKPLTQGLRTVSGLAGGVIRMLEAIGGVPGQERGVNDFFTVAELRCKVLQQITAEENDDTAFKLLNGKVFDEWLRNGLQNMGQQVTFRDLMKMLFQHIYYEMVPNPAAKFTRGTTGTTQDVSYTTALAKTVEGIGASQRLTALSAMAGAYRQSSLSVDAWRSTIASYRKQLAAAKAVLAKLTVPAFKKECIPVLAKIDEATNKLADVEASMDVTGSRFVQELKGWDVLEKLTGEASGLISKSTAVRTVTDKISSARSDALHSQIIRPDCWFVPPPVCNVVFPEQYSTLQYDRNYMGEVTRSIVWISNTLIGKDMLLSDRILAPNPSSFVDTVRQLGGPKGYRDLMPHELHTGIIPREEWLPNTASTSAEGQRSKGEAADPHDLLSWGQRSALYLFYKYRFAQRSASVGGRFNPNLVCGFPALVIRAPFLPDYGGGGAPAEAADDTLGFVLDNATALGAPVHLLGMVGTLSHTIGPDGGTSSFTMHHVRHHNGSDDEYLNLLAGITTSTENCTRDLRLVDILAMGPGKERERRLKYLTDCTCQDPIPEKAPEAPSVPSVTPGVGSTVTETETQPPPSQVPPPGTKFEGKWKVPLKSAVTRGSLGPDGQGKVTSLIVVNAARSNMGTGKKLVFEQVRVNWTQQFKLDKPKPVEQIIRPRSWFSEKYANDSIGEKIYQPFFGCNSIIDEFKASINSKEKEASTAVIETEGVYSMNTGEATVASVELDLNAKSSISIERAVNSLAFTYGKVKTLRGDVEDFIQQFTYRPVATKDDVLGADELEFDVAANGAVTPKEVSEPGTGMTYLPQVGFHSTAVHQQIVDSPVALAGLVMDNTAQLPRTSATGKAAEIMSGYDMRKDKRAKVLSYLNSLSKRGLRG